MNEHWSIVKRLVNAFKDLEDGKYAVVKLAYKPQIKIFKLPEDN